MWRQPALTILNLAQRKDRLQGLLPGGRLGRDQRQAHLREQDEVLVKGPGFHDLAAGDAVDS